MFQFAFVRIAGAAGVVVTLSDLNPTDSTTSPISAVAALTVARAGTVSSSGETPADWANPASASVGDAYEARLTVNTGSTPAGAATGSWLALSSDRSWSLTRSTIGTSTSNCTLEIRLTSSGVVQDSCTVIFTATQS